MNAAWGGDSIVRHGGVDVGMAVARRRRADHARPAGRRREVVFEVAAEATELAARAREKRLRPDEYQGGSFTVSNLGMFGIEAFYAIINPPEAAILSVGASRRCHGSTRRPGRSWRWSAAASASPATTASSTAPRGRSSSRRSRLVIESPGPAGASVETRISLSPCRGEGRVRACEQRSRSVRRPARNTRVERDTMGEMTGPRPTRSRAPRPRAPWRTSPSPGLRPHPAFIDATVRVKLAAARANGRLKLLPRERRTPSSRPRARCSTGAGATSSWSTSTRRAPAPRTT